MPMGTPYKAKRKGKKKGTKKRKMKKAKKYGYTINIIECQNRFDNVHDVPSYVIENMDKRWERITEN